MDRISGLNHIIEALRKQLEPSSRKSPAVSEKKSEKSKSTLQETPTTSSLNLKQLEHRIIERIKAINADSESLQDKASYVFVESILAWEFGENMLKDPEFSEIINKVNQAIQATPSLKNQINQLIVDMYNK